MSLNKILFTRFQGNVQAMFNDIYAIDPDGNNEMRLIVNPGGNGDSADNASPRYNKDMTRIAFLSSRDNPFGLFNVFTMTLSDHVVRQVTTGNTDMTSVDWAPDDSRFIVSCKDSTGILQVHVLSLDGVSLTQLTNGLAENANARWSPRGNLIAFTQFPPMSKTSHIWIMDSNGGNQRKLTTDETAHSNPSWSPDGSWIIFRCDLGTPHLRRINVYTGEIFVYLGPVSGADSSPIWSGKEIVFSSSRDWEEDEDIFNLYIMSENGENVRRLTTSQAFEYCGDW